MPWYKYKCNECGQEFDLFTSITNYKSTHECPECGEISPRNPKDLCTSFSVKCDGFFGKSK